MKKSIYIVKVILFLATAMSAAGHRDDDRPLEKLPHIQLGSSSLDLGDIVLDSIGNGIMKFTNTGDAPLVIHRVFTECGCTVPSYSGQPVAPGKTGTIKVAFKTKGRPLGFFRKTLRVKSNADNSRVSFTVKGNVIKK